MAPLIAGSCLCDKLGILGLGNRVCGLFLVCWWLQAGSGDAESLPEGSVFQELWLCMDYYSREAGVSAVTCPHLGFNFSLSVTLTTYLWSFRVS